MAIAGDFVDVEGPVSAHVPADDDVDGAGDGADDVTLTIRRLSGVSY